MKSHNIRDAFLTAAALACGSFSSTGLSAITLDGTLSPGGAPPGADYITPAKVGEQVGANLFHSFGVFDISTGKSATFTGPNAIQNVLGRVTSGSPSNIDELLRSTIPNADVKLRAIDPHLTCTGAPAP